MTQVRLDEIWMNIRTKLSQAMTQVRPVEIWRTRSNIPEVHGKLTVSPIDVRIIKTRRRTVVLEAFGEQHKLAPGDVFEIKIDVDVESTSAPGGG